MEIYVPSEKDNDKVIKFLCKVFHRPFPRLIPSLYGKGKNSMRYHFCLEKDGALRGALCAYPQEIKIGSVSINGLGIGMVATDKKARGQGIMSAMLEHSFNVYKDSADIACLTGLRHRYEHFGFYPCGVNYIYKISDSSSNKWKNGNPYAVVKAKSEEDFEAVDRLALTAEQVVKGSLATEHETLKNWFSKLYLLKREGKTVGFASGKFDVLERIYIEGGTVNDYIQGAIAFKKYRKKSLLKVEVLPVEDALKEAMASASEDYEIDCHAKFKVFSYKRLLEKLIAISLERNQSIKYAGVIEVSGREKLKINIEEGNFSVSETEEGADVVLEEWQAVQIFLGAEQGPIQGLQKIALRHSDFI